MKSKRNERNNIIASGNPAGPSGSPLEDDMKLMWWATKENQKIAKNVPTVSKLRLYVDDPPEFREDVMEWCCTREQLWAVKNRLADKCVPA